MSMERCTRELRFARLQREGVAEMSKGDTKDLRATDNSAVCVRKLNHTIGELARCYGTASVVAALTQIMGCSSCITDSVKRGASIRALVERMSVDR